MSRSDKGKSRSSYNMAWRLYKKQTADLMRTLEDFQRRYTREKTSRTERRAAARDAKLPKDRVCPICGEVKLRSRQWVVGKHVLCKSCFMRQSHG